MDIQEIQEFLAAGDAVFQLTNTKDGTKHIYRVTRHKDFDSGNRSWNVLVKVTLEGESEYGYLGRIAKSEFRHNNYSIVGEEDELFTSFDSLFFKVVRKKALPKYLEFTHMGRCGRCRRLLIDPKSVDSGIGPKCREYFEQENK